jgi:predicted ArsR family transcriptional regulator
LALLDSAEQRGVLPDVLLAERSQRHEKASHIVQAAAALLAEIERQPASAADPDLLARLGLSRQRIYQLLRQLEDADLVTATDENVGRGRPRKVYRVLHE